LSVNQEILQIGRQGARPEGIACEANAERVLYFLQIA
jgi:hypothetical protein